MAKVSIIVPVYNVAPYLSKCVDSILDQSMKEIEVILVDDGSMDDSGKICDRYAAQDIRVKVIHKENGGLSDARNAGIVLATGEYIGFVDGDDYIEREMFEVLYQSCLEGDTKIAACDYVYEGEKIGQRISWSTGESVRLSAEDFFRKVLLTPSATGIGVWDKLYQRDLFQHAMFRKGILHEDTDLLYRLVFQTDFIAYISRPYYIHCERKGSITKDSYGVRDYDRFKANGRMYRYIVKNHPKLCLAAADNHGRSMIKIVNNMVTSRVYDRKMYAAIQREARYLRPIFGQGEEAPILLRIQLRLICLGYFPYALFYGIYRLMKKGKRLISHEAK